METFGGYVKCKYVNKTEFGLCCDYSICFIPNDKDYKFPCPNDSGTDGKRNGICYGFSGFRVVE